MAFRIGISQVNDQPQLVSATLQSRVMAPKRTTEPAFHETEDLSIKFAKYDDAYRWTRRI
ncbi:hypothetical protein BCON_0263g00120 [Botryotinia convoluta]|uniref:Uncharacterized protein n=1 Tax=Botryotinia convoluta TaxID=54673 RepID=A0A4Z1HH96_9HELO|nr:hypothetical protein BCON_0263g00120 [Botryotinia convoluta]